MSTVTRALVALGWAALAGAVAWRSTSGLARVDALTRGRRSVEPRDRPAGTVRQPRRPLVGVTALALVSAVLLGPAAAIGLVTMAVVRRRWRPLQRRRRAAVLAWQVAPDVVALVQLAVTSGLTPYLALTEVAPLLPPPFAAGVTQVLADVHGGRRLADALQRLLAELGEPVRPLVAALTTSERYGVALLPALDAAAVELRRRRRHAAEARARRLPVLLSFPLVCCVLPAFVCLAIVPIAASALRSLRTPASAVVPAPSPGSLPASTIPGGSP